MKKIIYQLFYITLFIFHVNSGFSQSIDSIRKTISINAHDTTNISAYLGLAQNYFASKPDSGIFYWNKAKELTEKALTKKCDKKTSNRLLAQQAEALNGLGLSKNNVGDVQGALKDYFTALKIFEQLDDKIGFLTLYCNIGIIYYDQKDYDKAQENFARSVQIAESIHDSIGLSSAYNYMGYVLLAKKENEASLKAFLKAKDYTALQDITRLSYIYNDIGILHYRKKEYDKAFENYNYALKLRLQVGNKDAISASYNNIGSAYMDLGDFARAETYVEKSLAISKTIGYPSLIQLSAHMLKDIYKKLGKPAKALEMYELYIQMHDSIINRDNKRASIKSQLNYEFEKKEIEIRATAKAEQEKIELKAAEDKKRQNLIIYATLLILAVVSVLSFFIYRSLQQNKKKNIIIAKQKELVEEKQKEVMDSIYYAKRIQTALLPSEKYITRSLKDLKKD